LDSQVFVVRSLRAGWPLHNPANPHDPQGPIRFIPDFDPEIRRFVDIGPQQPSGPQETARFG